MAYTGTIVTEAEMQFFAGEQVDATGDVEANHQFLANYAEAYLTDLVKYDIVTNWATINALYKAIFTEWAARFAAISLIQFNTALYTNGLEETENMITIHTNRMEAIEKLLADSSVRDFLALQ